jgi:MYXO-CTERM domain-containing protein
VNEQLSGQGQARLEFVPFPEGDEAPSFDRRAPEVDPGWPAGSDTESAEPTEPAGRSKEATGWAASGLAGALRRSRRATD